ncbi:hypothetical protein GCM10011342_29190 [Aquisalinus flavus]|uniref:META domain-containing protein n=1 Tax=Aquisalinus flavus TaxID=1526572 RepID=A0A8J2V440_9PROT|nr:META domain-containing protein [Aquisalinus flavus]MBD0428101.1 META domain-containing protein [Aquisalinus flavus]GGD18659.1 hypothetical protein GCM10011342_29190 [Aquisalinus flavus]
MPKLSRLTLSLLGLSAIGLVACGPSEQDAADPLDAEMDQAADRPADFDDMDDVDTSDAYVFRCGAAQVAVRFQGVERMEMTVGDQVYTMFSVVSGSGAQFQSANDPNTVFWTEGDSAMLTLAGEDYPECTLVSEPEAVETGAVDTSAGTGDPYADASAGLGGSEWVVEDINGGGIIDSSRATLTFGPDGRVAGMASCNNYNASYEAGEGTLTVGPAAATRKMCAEALMNQETDFLNALEGISSWQITPEGALELSGDDVSIIARR